MAFSIYAPAPWPCKLGSGDRPAVLGDSMPCSMRVRTWVPETWTQPDIYGYELGDFKVFGPPAAGHFGPPQAPQAAMPHAPQAPFHPCLEAENFGILGHVLGLLLFQRACQRSILRAHLGGPSEGRPKP
jgi:hypothetical protein